MAVVLAWPWIPCHHVCNIELWWPPKSPLGETGAVAPAGWSPCSWVLPAILQALNPCVKPSYAQVVLIWILNSDPYKGISNGPGPGEGRRDTWGTGVPSHLASRNFSCLTLGGPAQPLESRWHLLHSNEITTTPDASNMQPVGSVWPRTVFVDKTFIETAHLSFMNCL